MGRNLCAKKMRSAKRPLRLKETALGKRMPGRMAERKWRWRLTCIQEDLHDVSVTVHDGLDESRRALLICECATSDWKIERQRTVSDRSWR